MSQRSLSVLPFDHARLIWVLAHLSCFSARGVRKRKGSNSMQFRKFPLRISSDAENVGLAIHFRPCMSDSRLSGSSSQVRVPVTVAPGCIRGYFVGKWDLDVLKLDNLMCTLHKSSDGS